MQEEINKIIEMAKKKYNISEIKNNILKKKGFCDSLFLVLRDDGSEYIQECEDTYDFYTLEWDDCLVAGNKKSNYSGYKLLIKLTEKINIGE